MIAATTRFIICMMISSFWNLNYSLGCLMRVPVLIQKHGQKCKQVLLLGSFCKAVLLANSGFWQASTRSAIQKCIYFLYECVFPKNLHYLSGSTLSLGTFCKAVLFAFYDFLSTSTLIRAADSHALWTGRSQQRALTAVSGSRGPVSSTRRCDCERLTTTC